VFSPQGDNEPNKKREKWKKKAPETKKQKQTNYDGKLKRKKHHEFKVVRKFLFPVCYGYQKEF
jgi:hypothetical protein